MGAVITALLFAGNGDLLRSTAIGYFYATTAVFVFRMITDWLAVKLTVFPTYQQWLIKAGLYTIGLSLAYLLGLVFHTLLLIPADALKEAVIDRFWQGFVYLITLPFSQNDQSQWLDLKMRSVVITFFTVLFLIGLVSLLFSLVEVRWRQERQKHALQQAELAALRLQMEPHFLFNTLNTIAALIKSDPRRSESLLVQLSHMLRFIFRHSGEQTVPLREELVFTEQFIAMLQARFGAGLEVKWQKHLARQDHPVPALLLQPLIENSIRHGRLESGGPLILTIRIEETDSAVVASVADNGRGIGPQRLNALPVPGHALANLAERLSLLFRRDDLLAIDSLPGKGTTVTIQIPVR
jgi:signal transduction histidine kinase